MSKDLYDQSKTVREKVFDTTVSSGETLTLSFKLSAAESVLTLYLGKEDATAVNGYNGYSVVITGRSITFYRQGAQLTEMAVKHTAVCPSVWYDLTFAFDEGYCTFYFHDDMEGVEPWPEFDLAVGEIDRYTVGMKEESVYGAEVRDVSVKPTEEKPVGGVTYTNPILNNHADPDILYYDGVYYLYATSKEYDVYTSTDLVNWEYRGKSLPGGGWGVHKHYWAPDVEEIGGKFYMAVSFGEDGFGIAVADSPLGPFVCQGEAPLLKKTIDGHIFVDDDGKVYLYYTSWWDGRSYGIYGVEMGDDLITPKWETERKLLTPTVAWEKHMGDVVEAPYMLKKDGVYYLVYSGSHTQSPHYAVGYAIGKSPLGAFVRSSDSPILNMTSDVHGPAHCCIVPAPDGSLVILYHCHNSLTDVYPRHTCIDRIRFAPTEGGRWRLEVWGPTSREMKAVWLS